MTEKWKEQEWAQDIWYSGKVTRRRVVGWGPTRGRDTWSKAGATIAERTPERIHDEVRRTLARLFTGG